MAPALSAQPNPAMAELLGQLAPNMEPAEANIWPLAPLYWGGLLLLIAAVAALVWWYWRGRRQRRYLKVVKRLASVQDATRQLQQLHALLRNAAALQDPTNKSLSDGRFAELVTRTLERSETPPWVNAHYRPNPSTEQALADADRLVRRWCR